MISTHPHFSHPKYRPDIDGLRAISVLSIVAFHAFPNWVKGGFIGVDVFFVISGYLISSIIFENLDKGTFSFSEFYARRIKRIFPALLIVLVGCYTFGWFALLADEYKQLGKHIAGGMGFVSNFVLWGEAGYFDNSTETKPLLHLWSLGVEEQFYIVWPLLLWSAWKRKFNLLTITIVIAFASFYLNVGAASKDAVATFYSPQTRVWELLCGSLLAWGVLYKNGDYASVKTKMDSWLVAAVYRDLREADGKTLANALSIAGMLLLAYGLSRINRDIGFPGKWALVPVLAAVLIIAAGPKSWFNRAILSSRPAIWFGLISFPLYLWHWPLLSFARIVASEVPSAGVRISVVALSVLLAWITYKLVEMPIRFGGRGVGKVISLVLLAILVGFVGYNTYSRDGLGFRNKDRQEFVAYFENSRPEWRFSATHKIFDEYRSDCDFYDLEAHRYGKTTNVPKRTIDKSCYTRDSNKAHAVFVWGDSHAQQLYSGLKKNLPANWQILQVASSSCPPSLTTSADSAGEYCVKSNLVAIESIETAKPDVVIVAQNDKHNAAAAEAIHNRLKELGVSKVIFLGPVPHWNTELPKIIARQLWVFTPERTFVGVNRDVMDTNQKLRREYLAKGLSYIDAIALFCNEDGCLTRIGSDRLANITTHDYGHLLPISSAYLASNILLPAIIGK